jgi:hypothetical protein
VSQDSINFVVEVAIYRQFSLSKICLVYLCGELI